jgi:hypothetical protein
MSVIVPARQYDLHGKRIRTGELWVNRRREYGSGKPLGEVGLTVSIGKRQIQLAISAGDWCKMNQEVWEAKPEHPSATVVGVVEE